eukprot:6192218-Pleurochrysis_carterae.AAC.1
MHEHGCARGMERRAEWPGRGPFLVRTDHGAEHANAARAERLPVLGVHQQRGERLEHGRERLGRVQHTEHRARQRVHAAVVTSKHHPLAVALQLIPQLLRSTRQLGRDARVLVLRKGDFHHARAKCDLYTAFILGSCNDLLYPSHECNWRWVIFRRGTRNSLHNIVQVDTLLLELRDLQVAHNNELTD